MTLSKIEVSTLLIFLLFITPLLVIPNPISFFEIPKVIVSEIAVQILMVLFLWRSHLHLDKKFFVPIAIIFSSSLVGLVFFNSETVFFGNHFRLQGTFLLWHLLILTIISSQIELKVPKFLPFAALSTLLFFTFFFGSERNGRAVGSLGDPNALAATGIFFWPFALFFANKLNPPKTWIFKNLSLVIVGVIIFLSGSRSGMLAFGAQTIFLLTLKLTHNLKIALSLGLLLIFTSLALPLFENTTLYENRVEVWTTSIQSGLESPLFGHGFGNIEHVLKKTAWRVSNTIRFQYVDSAHNIFLDYWVQSGLIGTASLLFLIYLSLKNFLIAGKSLELTLLIGVLAVLSFNPTSVVTLVAFWWLIGQGQRL